MHLQPAWSAPARVGAACSLREGGVSAGSYASLNVGPHVGDDAAAVAENRRRLQLALQLPSEPLWLQQVHGIEVFNADRQPLPATSPVADAAITRRAGAVLAVMVADCLPVLFCRDDGAAIAVAHAGWRGLAGGVLEATVTALGEPARLQAWIGPGIGAAHFEVGDEVRAAFVDKDAGAARMFAANPRGRWQCDLAALARQRLLDLGVAQVTDSGLCTHADARRFYSHRRDGRTGRMAALLWLKP